MSNPLLTFLPLIIGAGAAWMVAAFAIRIDLYRMHRERLQGKRPLWYAQPTLWFATFMLVLGLAFLILIWASLFFRPGFFVLIWLTLPLGLLLAGWIVVALEHPFREDDSPPKEIPLPAKKTLNSGSIAKTSAKTNMFSPVIGIYGVFTILGSMSGYLRENIVAFLLIWSIALIGLIIRLCFLKHLSNVLNRRRRALARTVERPRTTYSQRQAPERESDSNERDQLLVPQLVLHLKRPLVAAYLIVIAVFFILWLLNSPSPVSIIFIISIYPLNFFIYLLRAMRETVKATSAGLIVNQGAWIFARKKYQQLIRWEDAQLFVRYKTHGLFGGRTTTYELSNALQVVRWRQVTPTRSRFMFWELEAPVDEYNQRFEMLCACITEQTGLQLHDISLERVKKRQRQEIVMTQ